MSSKLTGPGKSSTPRVTWRLRAACAPMSGARAVMPFHSEHQAHAFPFETTGSVSDTMPGSSSPVSMPKNSSVRQEPDQSLPFHRLCPRAIGKIHRGEGEIELNLDLIDPRTFGELDGYVRECLGGD